MAPTKKKTSLEKALEELSDQVKKTGSKGTEVRTVVVSSEEELDKVLKGIKDTIKGKVSDKEPLIVKSAKVEQRRRKDVLGIFKQSALEMAERDYKEVFSEATTTLNGLLYHLTTGNMEEALKLCRHSCRAFLITNALYVRDAKLPVQTEVKLEDMASHIQDFINFDPKAEMIIRYEFEGDENYLFLRKEDHTEAIQRVLRQIVDHNEREEALKAYKDHIKSKSLN